MADITDPLVITFNNDQIRPIAERVRDLKVLIDSTVAAYFLSVDPVISGNLDADPIVDGRAGDGVSQLVKSDLVNFITQLQSLQTSLDGAGVMDTVRKPTVRPLRISG